MLILNLCDREADERPDRGVEDRPSQAAHRSPPHGHRGGIQICRGRHCSRYLVCMCLINIFLKTLITYYRVPIQMVNGHVYTKSECMHGWGPSARINCNVFYGINHITVCSDKQTERTLNELVKYGCGRDTQNGKMGGGGGGVGGNCF